MPTAESVVEWLEHHDALRIGQSPWRSLADDEDAYPVDFNRLFPIRRGSQKAMDHVEPEEDWLVGLDWAEEVTRNPEGELTDFMRRLDEALGASPPTSDDRDRVAHDLGWDTCAWYQPMHFFGNAWGIFIKRECILENAIWVARFLPRGLRPDLDLRMALIRSGFTALFLHEQFHHKVETLGIRFHVVENSSRYLPYVASVYKATFGTDDNLEEALANADAYSRAQTAPYSRWMGERVTRALREYLRWRWQSDPPGYRLAGNYVGGQSLNRGIALLHGQVQEAVRQPHRDARDWTLATRLHQSMFKVTDHIWEVVPTNQQRSLLPRAKWPASIPSRDMVRLAEAHGYMVKPGAGKGSHIVLNKPGAPPLTVPGNRRDLSPGVLKKLLKKLGPYGISDIPDLRKQLL